MSNRSLQRASVALNSLKLPTGPFDPEGHWEHRYTIWAIIPHDPSGKLKFLDKKFNQPLGGLTITRKPGLNDNIELEIVQTTLLNKQADMLCRVHARMTCARDKLSTPRSWEIRSVLVDSNGNPMQDSRTLNTGKVVGTLMHRFGQRVRKTSAPPNFSSNWSLFDALQRMPEAENGPIMFDLFEEMDAFKPNQRLVAQESDGFVSHGRNVPLRGFRQIGSGILPYDYWLDDQGRLLAAIGSMRAYIFDAASSKSFSEQDTHA